ncbi:hypothetical protein ACHBTE_15395 [Streptomyces sp. M41]|uniref:hypothetical protein n=1 Tax=Streptomyces sp. M41 TaxID=3059412 RepID=UPI00374D9D9A
MVRTGCGGCGSLHRTGQLYGSPGKAANMFADGAGGRARAALHLAGEQLEYDRHDVGEQQRIIAERFAGEGWEIPWLLTEMRAAEDFLFDTDAQVVMDTWANGRVVLLGDAGCCAAPTSGRGTSQALVGAYVPAGEPARADSDHTAAFIAYEQAMRPFVTEHQAVGREAAQRFFMPAASQEVLDMLAANAPENTGTEASVSPTALHADLLGGLARRGTGEANRDSDRTISTRVTRLGN